MVEPPKRCAVSEPVRVPDPVYEKLTREANHDDVSRGSIIKEWMEKAEKYEDMERRH